MTASDIKDAARRLSLDACGIAPLPFPAAFTETLAKEGAVPFVPEDAAKRTDACALLSDARAAIVILFPYKTEIEETDANIALYARARDYHRINRAYLLRLAAILSEAEKSAAFLPICDTSPLVDRHLAYLAGLGFYGKNHCLIHPKYGSYFTIGALLTNLDLAPDAPLSLTCGACTKCLAACPARALSEEGLQRNRCKSYLTQKKELTSEEETIIARTANIFGCDECQKICPYNKNAAPSPLPEIQASRIASLTKADLAPLSHRAFERTYGDYAFAWRGKNILIRNLELTEKSK